MRMRMFVMMGISSIFHSRGTASMQKNKNSIDVLILDLKIVIVVLKLWSYVLYYIAAVFVHILL
jgi:hypothetical protein